MTFVRRFLFVMAPVMVFALAPALTPGLSSALTAQEAARDPQHVRAAADTPADLSGASRVALVIGNSRYKQGPLRNPANDAKDIAVGGLAGAIAAAFLAAGLLVYGYTQRNSGAVTVNTFACLTRDNLRALYTPSALAYLCDRKTGQPMAPIAEGSRLLIGRSERSGLTLRSFETA